MKLRRKAATLKDGLRTESSADVEPVIPKHGPYDADALGAELESDEVKRVDLGGMLVAPGPGRDLRLQVDQKTGAVQAVMLAGPTGAVELKAFAAPRNGDLWGEIRPQIAADAARKGGTATEREGRFGTELVCVVDVKQGERTVKQTSRVIGINGPRWLLRATLLGEPARTPEGAEAWEDSIAQVAVRRGNAPMPVGEQLALTLPPGVQAPGAPVPGPDGAAPTED